MKRLMLAAALAVLTCGAANAAKPPAAIQRLMSECEQQARTLGQITESEKFAANFNAACALGLTDGYHQNVKERARVVDDLTANQNNQDENAAMTIDVMNVKYLRSYDAAEAEANKDGK